MIAGSPGVGALSVSNRCFSGPGFPGSPAPRRLSPSGAMTRALVASTLATALFVPATPAEAGQTRLLWATVNICDSPRYPNMVGVRASMPGNGRRQRMYMRFSASWYRIAEDDWRPLPGGRSGWIYVGSARFRARQGGYTFSVSQPPAGKSHVVRGTVDFQWRALRRRAGKSRWVVAKRVRATTRAGAPGVQEGDPPGLSLGACEVGA